jgi:hypothetical protein
MIRALVAEWKRRFVWATWILWLVGTQMYYSTAYEGTDEAGEVKRVPRM